MNPQYNTANSGVKSLVLPEAVILAGVDTGGTFTDVVVALDGTLRHCKVLSTPDDPSEAIHEGLERLGVAQTVTRLIHGTTVGTNAVLEGKGAKVVYVTSEGFGDVLTLGRQQRAEVYSLCQAKLSPPVPAALCLEVPIRITADGELLHRADEEALTQLEETVRELDPDAVAVNLLFSFLRPDEERRVASALGEAWFVSLSSEVLPESREYERGMATWLNASVGPVISRYLKKLQRRLPQAEISVMQSSGTTISAGQAAQQAVRLLLSGPAGGLAAARLLAQECEIDRLLSFDMGGTSTDVSLLEGELALAHRGSIASWPLTIPSVDIQTIGAGGGSIASVDLGGALKVGPESAGASPGPACYALGGQQPTVTDANLVLGRIPDTVLLGGYLSLCVESAGRVMDALAGELGCSRIEAAQGVIRLANEHMARALRIISVERGHDPARFALLGFGGAGGLHACELAELMGIKCIVLPARAGVLSAAGMLASEPGRDFSRAVLELIERFPGENIEAGFAVLEQRAAAQLQAEGIAAREIRYQRNLELRYRGQNESLSLDYEGGADHVGLFHAEHERVSGHRLDLPVELVNLRLSARAPAAMQHLDKLESVESNPVPGEGFATDLGQVVRIWDRECLPPGFSTKGPAIIKEHAATTWLAPGWDLEVDEWGNLRLAVNP